MNKRINKIIKNELNKLINEFYSVDDIHDKYCELEDYILNDFLYNNNSDFTKEIPWRVIKFDKLKKIWEDYMRTGIVRDTRGLDDIIEIMIINTLKISIITYLSGHSTSNPKYTFEEYFGSWVDEQVNCLLPQKYVDKRQLEIPFDNPEAGFKVKLPKPCVTDIHPFAKEVFDKNWSDNMTRNKFRDILMDVLIGRFLDYYTGDPDMGEYISDYGLGPLMTLINKLVNKKTPEEKLLIVDRMLNVIHPRSDIAKWYVEGGSSSLNKLSGYQDDEGHSIITGKYNLNDYM